MSEPQTAETTPEEKERAANQKDARERAKAAEALREQTRRAMRAFQHEDVGLPEAGAALLTVHLFHVKRDAAKLDDKELRQWALAFRHQNPVCWAPLLEGFQVEFVRRLGESGHETAKDAAYTSKVAVIRGS